VSKRPPSYDFRAHWRKPPPAGRRLADSTVRFVEPIEVRPDIILAHGKRGPWDAIEVQLRKDPRKARRWGVLVGALNDQRRRMDSLPPVKPFSTFQPAAAGPPAAVADSPGGRAAMVLPTSSRS
jgi:hypothetical protein